ncbi:monovalent cation:proton antiporter-2 (CPA2) family protein [Tropicimonas sp. TH_r6]|uniref:monovalent cation:proton antiporter-2 (CPA2) family protein n=1 Tax=Tropicimonas sp. TH_r6 TaxID=3082085 RepID=UPI002955A3B0|nr:monovalent cation:proton antiporter-2 (CPA2) family protein [Tropicimonas sp. TH_r6]MDV7142897.1 monovalent cation:proton antiporter-2 (CPA2) family protein [Tropicimonas sp. TH_r6]
MDSFLLTAFLFLCAGAIAVPIATRLGLGSVLGYLIAGIVLGPVLSTLGVDVVGLQHFAEFGVVMMLFLVGLELEPRLLWEMRARLLGLGGLQVAGTTGLIMGAAILFGQPWTIALATGLVLALSSTAIVLQTLNEKGLMKSDGGQASFSVLLFQDIAVIPMLALIPLLALPELTEHASAAAQHGGDAHGDGHGLSLNITEGLPGWATALVTLAAIAAVIGIGSWLTRPLFRYIAMANLRELFVGAALLLVIGIALLMTIVGLSPALGTFLAGVVLANSEYRHELESDIDPFRGLLLGVFFMTVGALIDFELLFSEFATILGMTFGVMLLKAAVLFALALAFRLRGADRSLFSLGLAQAGEFGFVLLSFTVANNVLPEALADRLLLVVALSMLFTPALFVLYDRVLAPRTVETQSREADEIDDEAGIVIAGYGRFGGVINRMLRANGFETVVLDFSSEQLEILRSFGNKVFYGDATRPDLLHAAGIGEAKLFIIAIDDKEQITGLVHYMREHHPQVHVIARAIDRHHVYELYAAGCRDIIRETFDSSVRAARSALEALGLHPFEAELRAKSFTQSDRKRLAELAEIYDPETPVHLNEAYVARSKQASEEEREELSGKTRQFSNRASRGWVPPTLEDLEAEIEMGED